MQASSSTAARRRPKRKRRQPTASSLRAQTTTPVASLAKRAPSPSKPLLPLVVSKGEVAARNQTARGAGGGVMPENLSCATIPGGFLSLIERGELPADYDLEPVLALNGPMRSVRAPLHAAVADRRRRQPVMTEVSGFKTMGNLKLDYGEIGKLPAKMNVMELRKWEVEDAAEKAQAAKALSSSSSDESTVSSVSSTTSPPTTSTSPSGPNREDPRTYAELLDLYSMHEFIIRKGKTLRNTPEFASFKRHYAAAWGNIDSMITALECLLGSYGVDLAYIDGKKLAALASYQFGPDASPADLVECIANSEEVEPLLGNMAHKYRYGQRGRHLAAAKIQSAWRMYRQTIAYKHLLLGTRAAAIIQRQWAIYRAHCMTKRTIQAARQTRVMRWKQTMAQFCERWPRIRQSRRTIIHIPSLSYPAFHAKKVPFFMAQQLGQLTRLCDLADPKVEIVFVVPFKPELEVVSYYESLLEESGIGNAKGRFTFLVPEEATRLPDGMSLTRLVLMSSRLVKMLRALSTGKPAYIVPGVIGPEELLLASELNLPLLGPEPPVAQVFGTKSGCHRLLEAADVPTPAGARQIHTRADLLRALANLMLTHRECTRWLVKLETESGSRGHAYFDVGRMKTLKNAALIQQAVGVATATVAALPGAANGAAAAPSAGAEGGGNASLAGGPGTDFATAGPAVFDLLLKELEDYGAKRVRLVHQSAYPDWAAYLEMLDAVGACIEAVPSKPIGSVTANLFVEPSGDVQLHSVVEPLLAPAYTIMGSCCPPSIDFPRSVVEDAAVRVAKAASRKHIFGYLSVDFVLFTDREPITAGAARPDGREDGAANSPPTDADAVVRVWGVDVDLCWTNNAVAHHFAAMLSSTRAGGKDGRGRKPLRNGGDPGAAATSPRAPPSRTSSDSSATSAHAAAEPEGPQYVYSGIIYNPFISSIRHTSFFSLCRSRGVSYDRERQSGVVFHLVDVLLRGCLGVLSLGPDRQRNVKRMSAFQSLLNMELPKQGEHSAESNFAYFSAVVRQLARIVSTKTES